MSASANFARFLDIMLPEGGCALALAEVYMDESYEDRAPRILCVSGYVFRKRKAVEFSRDWAAYLKRKGLPYFHANECAHGDGVFKDRTDRVEVATSLIQRTRKMTAFGFSATCDEDAYNELVAPRERMGSAYTMLLLSGMIQVRRWMERTGFDGQVAYFFEAGHKHQGHANEFMEWLFASDRIQQKYGYAGHAFLPKATPALHPADLLAWQWRLESKRQLEPNRKYPVRKDLEALVRPHDMTMNWTPEELAIVGRGLLAKEKDRALTVLEALRTGVMPAMPD